MERRHALQHVRELRTHISFLRPMRPGNPTYLMWIGDIADLANTVWGSGSSETLRLAGALHGAGAAGTGAQAVTDYLERLRTLDEILAEFEAELVRED